MQWTSAYVGGRPCPAQGVKVVAVERLDSQGQPRAPNRFRRLHKRRIRGDDVVIFKRSMASGYSGIDNPLFYRDNSRMLFGDAKTSVDALLGNMQAD